MSWCQGTISEPCQCLLVQCSIDSTLKKKHSHGNIICFTNCCQIQLAGYRQFVKRTTQTQKNINNETKNLHIKDGKNTKKRKKERFKDNDANFTAVLFNDQSMRQVWNRLQFNTQTKKWMAQHRLLYREMSKWTAI